MPSKNHHQDEVISIINRNIKSCHEKDYDDWLGRYLNFERKIPGCLGTTVFIPRGNNSNL
jgi:antibiotic biosynthesis monooxygenase (ABM) superfamily enzyme